MVQMERKSMRGTIRYTVICGSLILAVLSAGCKTGGQSVTYAGEQVPAASAPQKEEEIIYLIGDDDVTDQEKSSEKRDSLINPEGKTLEERFFTPEGYTRIPREMGSFQGYLRRYAMKPDQSPVLLYDGSEKQNQSAHAAVFSMPVFDGDLQQCADSIIRIYSEYFWKMGDYDKIAFHLTNGFLMDYPAWKSGKRLVVDGNKTSWVSKSGSDDSYETFLKYLRTVMIYAGTLSLNEEAVPVNVSDIQAGDMFIKGGSPGHCVMVADVAQNRDGSRCFLLAQGYMPAQEFQIIKNPLHGDDPWYYAAELNYPLVTPEYVFDEGSLKRWYGFGY